ncbi:MAG: Gfo/Idh/MocA family oxidoreductase [Gemmiger sp.]|nr:Gfo/Idh/MocA family oxidoreductase [Gemmiger sp.]
MKNLAVVGFGARAEGMLRNLNTFDLDTQVTAVVDSDPAGASQRLKSAGFDPAKATFYPDVDAMLSTASVDGVVVATNCNTHTAFALQAMKYNLPMLLEKPVAVSDEQLQALYAASKRYTAQALVSFPLRVSYLCQLAKKIIDRGEIGQVQHVEAFNNVSYGRVYYKSWYRDDAITGGLFLQKATHDLDCINYLLPGRKPVQLCAMESKQIFKGTMPAGLTCERCEKYHTCPESTLVLKNDYHNEDPGGNGCSFAVDTGNHDSASVLVRYSDGMHAVYTQNFYARKSAAKRGQRLIGFDGTLEFDWVTGDCVVHYHKDLQTARYHIDDNALYHYGGDKALCENFVSILHGGQSVAPLYDGILSAHMCLQARKSAQTCQFMALGLDQ